MSNPLTHLLYMAYKSNLNWALDPRKPRNTQTAAAPAAKSPKSNQKQED